MSVCLSARNLGPMTGGSPVAGPMLGQPQTRPKPWALTAWIRMKVVPAPNFSLKTFEVLRLLPSTRAHPLHSEPEHRNTVQLAALTAHFAGGLQVEPLHSGRPPVSTFLDFGSSDTPDTPQAWHGSVKLHMNKEARSLVDNERRRRRLRMSMAMWRLFVFLPRCR